MKMNFLVSKVEELMENQGTQMLLHWMDRVDPADKKTYEQELGNALAEKTEVTAITFATFLKYLDRKESKKMAIEVAKHFNQLEEKQARAFGKVLSLITIQSIKLDKSPEFQMSLIRFFAELVSPEHRVAEYITNSPNLSKAIHNMALNRLRFITREEVNKESVLFNHVINFAIESMIGETVQSY